MDDGRVLIALRFTLCGSKWIHYYTQNVAYSPFHQDVGLTSTFRYLVQVQVLEHGSCTTVVPGTCTKTKNSKFGGGNFFHSHIVHTTVSTAQYSTLFALAVLVVSVLG